MRTPSRTWLAVLHVLDSDSLVYRTERFLDDDNEYIRPGIKKQPWSSGEAALIVIALSLQSSTHKVSLFDALSVMDVHNSRRVIEAIGFATGLGPSELGSITSDGRDTNQQAIS